MRRATSRRVATVLALLTLLLVAASASTAGPAAAQSTAAIGGTIRAPGEGDERTPVDGIEITVSQDGETVGSDETDEDGEWHVEVPGAGTYEVTLDVDTLPEELSLRDPDRATLPNVRVRGGQDKTVLFPLVSGEGGGGGGAGAFDRLADLAANGLNVGAIVALAAVGLSLIFGVTGLVNFAHGELVTIGAVAAWWANASVGGPQLPLVAAAVVGVAAGAGVGYGLERGMFRPLRRRRMSNISLIVVTIGLSMFLRHVILFLFGGAPRKYTDYALQRGVDIGPVSMQPKDIVITGIALALLALVGILLKRTRTGTAMRAVADNAELAESSGIDVERIILVTWVSGAALAALGGILYGTSQTVSWDTGFILLLIMFAAVILGGLGSAYGAMAGGLVVGLVSELSTYWLETEFKLVTALVVLIAVLLVRPQGILGIRERVG